MVGHPTRGSESGSVPIVARACGSGGCVRRQGQDRLPGGQGRTSRIRPGRTQTAPWCSRASRSAGVVSRMVGTGVFETRGPYGVELVRLCATTGSGVGANARFSRGGRVRGTRARGQCAIRGAGFQRLSGIRLEACGELKAARRGTMWREIRRALRGLRCVRMCIFGTTMRDGEAAGPGRGRVRALIAPPSTSSLPGTFAARPPDAVCGAANNHITASPTPPGAMGRTDPRCLNDSPWLRSTLGLTEAFKKDPAPHKISLGVGVYKDERTDAHPGIGKAGRGEAAGRGKVEKLPEHSGQSGVACVKELLLARTTKL